MPPQRILYRWVRLTDTAATEDKQAAEALFDVSRWLPWSRPVAVAGRNWRDGCHSGRVIFR